MKAGSNDVLALATLMSGSFARFNAGAGSERSESLGRFFDGMGLGIVVGSSSESSSKVGLSLARRCFSSVKNSLLGLACIPRIRCISFARRFLYLNLTIKVSLVVGGLLLDSPGCLFGGCPTFGVFRATPGTSGRRTSSYRAPTVSLVVFSEFCSGVFSA